MDISTEYTKDRNKTKGRNGYGQAHREKVTIISPANYGGYLNEKKVNKKRRNYR